MVIFLNGTTSSGKTSLSKALQNASSEFLLHVSVDNFLSQISEKDMGNQALMAEAFPNIVKGFHASAAATARAGNKLVVDYVLQDQVWLEDCVNAFKGLDVLFVGVHCPLEILEQREKERGDRHVAERVFSSIASMPMINMT
ncbi:phosphotransferase-like protein [Vibrio sonorensis]|uniref:phosphotransferase-like protein n=1 Tax=Vibrio sonorensis TaxID=1004316 RepID=UPI0008DA24A5|nr:AAA family ATPase [Vibrio sonorensis]